MLDRLVLGPLLMGHEYFMRDSKTYVSKNDFIEEFYLLIENTKTKTIFPGGVI